MKESKNFLYMHRLLEQGIIDYNMIEDNDHILIALSSGKDSSMLLKLLTRKKIKLAAKFELTAVFVRQGMGDDDKKIAFLTKLCEENNVKFVVLEALLENNLINDKKPCYTCSRIRRLALLDYAGKVGAKKIAFGHHKDDFIETLMLNIFYSNRIATMKPYNPFFKGQFYIIRPMVYIDEKYIIKEWGEFPKFAKCKFEDKSQRMFVRKILDDIYHKFPKAKKNVFRALYTIETEYLLKEPNTNIR